MAECNRKALFEIDFAAMNQQQVALMQRVM
jgi:hypothetical protein